MDPITGLLVFGAGTLVGGTVRQQEIDKANQCALSWYNHAQSLEQDKVYLKTVLATREFQLASKDGLLRDKDAEIARLNAVVEIQRALEYAPKWTEPDAPGNGNGQHPS